MRIADTTTPASPDAPVVDKLTGITEGAEPATVGPWLAGQLHDPRWSACSVSLIAGGMSNLTYLVGCRAGELVLRRPPLGHVLATAHDMVREHRVITALEPTSVPVPRTMVLSRAAENPLEVDVYAMERVVGHVCRAELPAGYADEPAQRTAIGHALVDVLAALHTVDPEVVGLDDFGRPAGFMERQLRRWSRQWELSKVDDMPALDRLRDTLVERLPPEAPHTIVHGDFRLDNCVLHPVEAGKIIAVLDWEMSTLGDPLADFAAMLAYWAEAGENDILTAARIVPPVTMLEGFPDRAALITRYAEQTGYDVSDMDWYQAFAYFKIAVICQGIAARAAGGAMLGSGFDEAQALVAPQVSAGLHLLGLPPA